MQTKGVRCRTPFLSCGIQLCRIQLCDQRCGLGKVVDNGLQHLGYILRAFAAAMGEEHAGGDPIKNFFENLGGNKKKK